MASLITGASRGIGRGIALELAKAGRNLVINYAGNAAAAQETASACRAAASAAGKSIRAEVAQADVGVAGDRQKLLDFTLAKFGKLDLLVNNAGIGSVGRPDILDLAEENFDRLMAVNLKGPFFLTQLAAKWMIAHLKKPQDSEPVPRPMIINISSVSAYTASTNRADYSMAKSALGMMTKLYAARLAELGIHVFELRPGIIASDMTAPVKEKYDRLIAEGLTPIRRWGTPEDVGRAVAMLAGDALPFSTGEVINIDGGFHVRRL
jgi:NAD(P)-dependent dehydrogenase (short-subunit alcohol dehydrogenase family)